MFHPAPRPSPSDRLSYHHRSHALVPQLQVACSLCSTHVIRSLVSGWVVNLLSIGPSRSRGRTWARAQQPARRRQQFYCFFLERKFFPERKKSNLPCCCCVLICMHWLSFLSVRIMCGSRENVVVQFSFPAQEIQVLFIVSARGPIERRLTNILVCSISF